MNENPFETPRGPDPPPPKPSLTDRIGTQRPPHSYLSQPEFDRAPVHHEPPPPAPVKSHRVDIPLGCLTTIGLTVILPVVSGIGSAVTVFPFAVMLIIALIVFSLIVKRPRFAAGLGLGLIIVVGIAILLVGACFALLSGMRP